MLECKYLLYSTAIGCPVPDIEAGVSVKMDEAGRNAVLTCNSSGEITHLLCQNNQWIGRASPCPPHPTSTCYQFLERGNIHNNAKNIIKGLNIFETNVFDTRKAYIGYVIILAQFLFMH